MSRQFPKPIWIQNGNTPCPCGSKLTYRKCCKPHFELREQYYSFIQSGDLINAERAIRAKLCEYAGWVLCHTIFALERGGFPAEMIKIDINALEEITERLAWVQFEQGKGYAVGPLFSHLDELLPLPGWKERLLYLECIWLASRLGRENEALVKLASKPNFRDIEDERLLQVYLQLKSDLLSPIEHLELVDRISQRIEDPTERIQYGTLKAILLDMSGDHANARQFHEKILSDNLALAEPRGNAYRLNTLADTFEYRWQRTGDPKDLVKVREYLEQIDLTELIPEGRARVLHELGRTYLKAREYGSAIESLTNSANTHFSVLPIIYRIEALVRNGNLDAACADYEMLSSREVPPRYELEFITCASVLALGKNNKTLAGELLRNAKSLRLSWPYFSSQRDQLCIRLLEFMSAPTDVAVNVERQGFLFRILDAVRSFSSYLELKPNVMGLGLNLNKLLEPKDGELDSKSG